ncbi:Er Membrane Protein Complex Subunit 2, partial [Manis pentadactyla]
MKYVLFLLVVVLCVWCVASFVTLKCTCALRTAFLGGYVRGVSVCDCALVCVVLSVPYMRVKCVFCVSVGMYLCKDFHVYCEQFCALKYVLAFLDGYVRGVSVCDCAL